MDAAAHRLSRSRLVGGVGLTGNCDLFPAGLQSIFTGQAYFHPFPSRTHVHGHCADDHDRAGGAACNIPDFDTGSHVHLDTDANQHAGADGYLHADTHTDADANEYSHSEATIRRWGRRWPAAISTVAFAMKSPPLTDGAGLENVVRHQSKALVLDQPSQRWLFQASARYGG